MHNLHSIPKIIHVQDRDIDYYMENNNAQYKNKYKNTYSYKQNDKENNDNDAYLQRLHGPDRVLLSLVDNLYIAFRIASSRRDANHPPLSLSNYPCCNPLQLSKSLHS